jgi:hypothetical protein
MQDQTNKLINHTATVDAEMIPEFIQLASKASLLLHFIDPQHREEATEIGVQLYDLNDWLNNALKTARKTA